MELVFVMVNSSEKIIIIGAGMAGCFLGICLAKLGFLIEIYEARGDARKKTFDSGRSFNLTLYYRGIQAMRKVGIWEEVRKICALAEGNVAHYVEKYPVFDRFDAVGNEVLYTVHRNDLNGMLLNLVSKFPNVKVFFDTKCVKIDREKKVAYFERVTHPLTPSREVERSFDVLVGADGVNSVARSYIQQGAEAEHSQVYEDWGYKEVHVSPALAEKMNWRLKATHTWSRANSLLIAFPNPDRSFTLMFNLPLEGGESFASLISESLIRRYTLKYFPDLEPVIPEIARSFVEKPTGSFVTVKTKPWYFKDFMVLVGDAAHGCLPFYGQGMCAAFEDCLEIAKVGVDREMVFREYQESRKVNTDVLGVLSKENFVELRDKSRSAFYIFKDKFDTFFSRLLPTFWLPPLYVMIAHGDMGYTEAVRRYRRQQMLERCSGIDFVLFLLSIPVSAVKFFRVKFPNIF